MAPGVPPSPSSSDGRLETLPPRVVFQVTVGPSPAHPKPSSRDASETQIRNPELRLCPQAELFLCGVGASEWAGEGQRPDGLQAPGRSGEGPREVG